MIFETEGERTRWHVSDEVCTYYVWRTLGLGADGRATHASIARAFCSRYDGDPTGSIVEDSVTGERMVIGGGL